MLLEGDLRDAQTYEEIYISNIVNLLLNRKLVYDVVNNVLCNCNKNLM